MTYTVYALRCRGEREPRYIGMTQHTLAHRLRGHFSYATGQLAEWLVNNRDKIEAIRLAETEDREVAKATEKLMIASCVALEQRLLNQSHMPGRKETRRRATATPAQSLTPRLRNLAAGLGAPEVSGHFSVTP